MLRFRPHSSDNAQDLLSRRKRASRLRWRVWLLLIALGLVIATMRQLGKPSTAQRLGQLFSVPESTTQQEPEHQIILSVDEDHSKEPIPLQKSTDSEPTTEQREDKAASEITDSSLAQVQDNTYFRPSEDAAWFELLGKLQQTSQEKLTTGSAGEVTYAQLLKQPQVYRGKLVTISGTARREEVASPAENSLDLKTYHRLIIQPRGGGHWPFVVYSLNLPAEFPKGDDIQASLSVTGYFFKNWSYAWQEGLGVAPVVLAKNVDWLPKAKRAPRRTLANIDPTIALLGAGIFALLVVYLAIRNTRRPRHQHNTQVTLPDENSTTETVREQLERLAENEARE